MDGTDPSGLYYDNDSVCHFSAADTLTLLNQANGEATAGRVAGLQNIYNNSTGQYDFGFRHNTQHDTWTFNGKTMNANQMGNFVAGFQGAAYDKKYNDSVPVAQTTVEAYGIKYHLLKQTKAKDDPFDRTGMPDIKKGEAAGMTFKPAGTPQDIRELTIRGRNDALEKESRSVGG